MVAGRSARQVWLSPAWRFDSALPCPAEGRVSLLTNLGWAGDTVC
jgi:hypothetical protein